MFHARERVGLLQVIVRSRFLNGVPCAATEGRPDTGPSSSPPLFCQVAPVTAPHIRKLMEMGCYNTNLFFRVDKGFVAQVDAVTRGRLAKLDQWQRVEAEKKVPLEVVKEVKHNKRGILSMGRYSDPNTGTSSFSILLGPAPHLDMQYTIFGEVTKGLETLTKMEGVETHREGIFVMPKERITIHSTYTYVVDEPDLSEQHLYSEELGALRSRHAATSTALQKLRQKQLPGS